MNGFLSEWLGCLLMSNEKPIKITEVKLRDAQCKTPLSSYVRQDFIGTVKFQKIFTGT